LQWGNWRIAANRQGTKSSVCICIPANFRRRKKFVAQNTPVTAYCVSIAKRQQNSALNGMKEMFIVRFLETLLDGLCSFDLLA
jgi:hypothetical protein